MTHVAGYPKRTPNGLALTDFKGKVLGYGHVVNCTKIRPGAPGGWISSERCSYRFKVGSKWYAGRGYGEGMAFTGRVMKKSSTKGRMFASDKFGRR